MVLRIKSGVKDYRVMSRTVEWCQIRSGVKDNKWCQGLKNDVKVKKWCQR